MNTTIPNGWRKVCEQQVLPVHRTGWPGAWDALVAAVTGRPRLTAPRAFSVSVLVKGEDPVRVVVTDQKVALICKP